MKKEILILGLLLLVSLPAVRSLLLPGGFTSHDLTHHIVRQISMDKLLAEGQFPPRWSGDLAAGFGYPVFLFNYPLPALVGEVFHWLGFNFLNSVKATLLLSLMVSTLGMYLFLRSLLNCSLAAFLGAAFYLYAPIHLIVVYVSGAVGASLGLVYPPFIFWAIFSLMRGKNRFILVGALALAGLILSHNITAFMFMPLIVAFIIVLKLLKDSAENRYFLPNVVLMFLLGIGLSAFFWLPAMVEKQFIRYDQLMQGIYLDQFPSLRQIIYSPWGYGLSHPKLPEGGMSYSIGLIHLLVVIILTLMLFFFRKKKMFFTLGVFIITSFVISIFFMLELSLPLWKSLPFLAYIQFPVRILVVPTFVASIASALCVYYLPKRKLVFAILLGLVLYANRNHLGINQKYDPGEEYYTSLKTSTTSFDENLPIWVSKIKTDPTPSKFTFLSGEGAVKILENKSVKIWAEIESTQTATIRFNQYFFPGWEIVVDGSRAQFDYLRGEDSGLPIFSIDKGKHLVKVEFKNTLIRDIADKISIITVIIIIIIICRQLAQNLSRVRKSF